MRLPRRLRWALATVLAAATVLGTTAAATAAPAGRHHPTGHIAWRACDDPDFAGMDCGTLRVPVDWARPHGERLTLALVRRPADDHAHRIGTLLINNGIGRSAIEQFRYALPGLKKIDGVMVHRFDLVAVDPRGIGHSTPVRCAEPVKPAGLSYVPKTRAGFRKLVAHNRKLGRDCLRRTGSLVAHMDLTSTAHDIEAVRVALGERRLNWYGIQYSDLLGRTYARLYPGRLRTMILDTAVDDTLSPVARSYRQAGAAEDAFDRFTAWCAGSPDCALHGHDVADEYDALVARADRHPIDAGPGHDPMTGEDIRSATYYFLPVREVWPLLATAISRAESGDASLLAAHSFDRTGTRLQKRVQACLDNPRQVHGFRQLHRVQRRLARRSPHLGGVVSSAVDLAGCIGWPVRPRPVRAGRPVWGAPPALVVQSTHQSVAPHSAGYAMARQLPGSVVLSHEGDDYSMYMVSACIRAHADRYLTTLDLPRRGTTCTD